MLACDDMLMIYAVSKREVCENVEACHSTSQHTFLELKCKV